MQYRAEIDGLRALAVIPVILFHAGIQTFSGGFVGVDVFFVISGYLITTIILSDLDKGQFSILNFYERRARRILPVLFFVMLVCIPFALLWFLPSDIKDFSESLIAVSTFSSNILFWYEGGYFGASEELKPLLHTWSLSVEEQYYIFFPIFLILTFRLAKVWVIVLLVFIALLSLAVAQWGAYNKPTGAFYLLPARGWELLIGAFAAFYMNMKPNTVYPKLIAQLLSAIGFLLIFCAILVFDEHTPFPSLYALVPTVGAVLIIVFAVPGTVVNKILSNKLLVGIGLISYSAYLWHQPLLAFIKYRFANVEYFEYLIYSALFATLILSLFSYKYIEKPFRFSVKRSVIVPTLASLFVVMFLPYFLTKNLADPYEYAGAGINWYGAEFSKKDFKPIVLYGDSHARQYYRAIEKEFSSEIRFIGDGGCMSLPNIVNVYNGKALERSECIAYLDQLKHVLASDKKPQVLIIAYRWTKEIVDILNKKTVGHVADSDDAAQFMLASLAELLLDVSRDTKVLVIGNVPAVYSQSEDMADGYTRCKNYQHADCTAVYPREFAEGESVNRLLRQQLSNMENVYYIDPATALCADEQCYVLSDGQLLYSDQAHLTKIGAEKVIGLVPDELKN